MQDTQTDRLVAGLLHDAWFAMGTPVWLVLGAAVMAAFAATAALVDERRRGQGYPVAASLLLGLVLAAALDDAAWGIWRTGRPTSFSAMLGACSVAVSLAILFSHRMPGAETRTSMGEAILLAVWAPFRLAGECLANGMSACACADEGILVVVPLLLLVLAVMVSPVCLGIAPLLAVLLFSREPLADGAAGPTDGSSTVARTQAD